MNNKKTVIKINMDKMIAGVERIFKYAFGIITLLDLYCVISGNSFRNWRCLLADFVLFAIMLVCEDLKRSQITSMEKPRVRKDD